MQENLSTSFPNLQLQHPADWGTLRATDSTQVADNKTSRRPTLVYTCQCCNSSMTKLRATRCEIYSRGLSWELDDLSRSRSTAVRPRIGHRRAGQDGYTVLHLNLIARAKLAKPALIDGHQCPASCSRVARGQG